MIGTWGPITFNYNGSGIPVSKVSRSAGADWATHDLIGGKPRSQYRGGQLETVDIDITLTALLGGKPRGQLDRLKALAQSAVAYPLVIGGRPVCSLPVKISSYSESWGRLYDGGELASASVSISFEEYR